MILTEKEQILYRNLIYCQDKRLKKYSKILHSLMYTNLHAPNEKEIFKHSPSSKCASNINKMLTAYLNNHFIPLKFRREKSAVWNLEDKVELNDIDNAIYTSNVLDSTQKNMLNTYVQTIISMYRDSGYI